MTLAHEMQHLVLRRSEIIYSPAVVIEDNEMKQFFNTMNDGMPLESGHLYWALMTGVIGLEPSALLKILGNKALTCDFWSNLPNRIPIINKPAVNKTQVNRFARVPFSLEIRNKDMLRIF